MQLSELNRASDVTAKSTFLRCCSANRWATKMVDARPYHNHSEIQRKAAQAWQSMEKIDFLEAFDGHPQIGDPDSLKDKFRNTHAIASDEQSGVETASTPVLNDLIELNSRYQKKFGYIFIVCASGKSAQEMRDLIKARIQNDPDIELRIAAKEQAKITALRIDNLIE